MHILFRIQRNKPQNALATSLPVHMGIIACVGGATEGTRKSYKKAYTTDSHVLAMLLRKRYGSRAELTAFTSSDLILYMCRFSLVFRGQMMMASCKVSCELVEI